MDTVPGQTGVGSVHLAPVLVPVATLETLVPVAPVHEGVPAHHYIAVLVQWNRPMPAVQIAKGPVSTRSTDQRHNLL